ncbi:hypothetical protein BGW38_006879 [Lunasporangiospora selenospora]|uniref:Uncharacterized protein n=1 Tax=Lunasporangiospora selenospora TaxID=979761 RepID=A0A9P6KGQ7_9FUNG|nr:hypothetical protein BGW38_006879 [Lunasporangiospora selenospora]
MHLHHPLPPAASSDPFSARSSFLRAFGKFKSKHLQNKRSSAPVAPIQTHPIADIGSIKDRPVSFVLPPIQIDDLNPRSPTLNSTTRLPTDTGSALFDDSTSNSNKYTPEETRFDLGPPEIDNSFLPPPAPLSSIHNSGSSSSLRSKFKNKVNHTLASMKSSTNLRERAVKNDPSLGVTGEPSGTTGSDPTALLQQQEESKNRHSKSFWTFPRTRPDTDHPDSEMVEIQERGIPTINISTEPDSTLVDPSLTTDPTAQLSLSLPRRMRGLSVEDVEVDKEKEEGRRSSMPGIGGESDQSLDIIMPVDYEDYTQFAELPLKKRKKMEKNLAAAATGKRPHSLRMGADAMKRLLTQQPKQSKKEPVVIAVESKPHVASSTEPLARHGSKKRRPFSAEVDEGALDNVQEQDELQQQQHRSAAATHADTTRSHARSGSVSSTRSRSRSFATSTHPALYATTVAGPRSPGLRRETLEMAMRRRRQSSAARSGFYHQPNNSSGALPELPPLSSEFFGHDNASATNVTHTFTSFTFELAEMHAHEVVNNSAMPGLFIYKQPVYQRQSWLYEDSSALLAPPLPPGSKHRASRLTVSSSGHMDMDTDHEFRAFDSDGDAISGYTGDADLSMEETLPPILPPLSASSSQRTKASNSTSPSSANMSKNGAGRRGSGIQMRRKISSVDGDSDTVPELPTLQIRTRDLSRGGSSGGRGGHRRSGSGSPASPRAYGHSRGKSSSSITHASGATADASINPSPRTSLTIEEIVSWKPREMYPHGRAMPVSNLDTKSLKPAARTGSSGVLSSSTTLAPSAGWMPVQNPFSQSPAAMAELSDYGFDHPSPSRHDHSQQQQSSSSSSMVFFDRYRHQQQTSGDTLVSPSQMRHPSHHVNFSSATTTSTLYNEPSGVRIDERGHAHERSPSELSNLRMSEALEFDPSEAFPPTTPQDLKAMDFEALLAAAEKEHQKGWDELVMQKRVPGSTPSATNPVPMTNSQPLKVQHQLPQQPSGQRLQYGGATGKGMLTVPPLRSSHLSTSQKLQPLPPPQQLSQQPNRLSVVFDLPLTDDGGSGGMGSGTGTGSDRSSTRSRRVMKKKTSVIRLAANGNGIIQGRREDDGVIRVSFSSSRPNSRTGSGFDSDGRSSPLVR